MSKEYKALKFLLYPDEEQVVTLAKTFGCVRFIYNRILVDTIKYYRVTGQMLKTTPAPYKIEYEWLKEIDSLALANAQLDLDTAFKNYFCDENFGFPKLKRKDAHSDSYTTNLVNGNIEIIGNYLKLPKIGRIKFCQHRSIPTAYKLKSVTVSQEPSGKYYASLLYEYEANIKQKEPKKAVGLDFSMKGLYVTSDGVFGAYPHYYRQSQEKLAKEQSKLSHRTRREELRKATNKSCKTA